MSKGTLHENQRIARGEGNRGVESYISYRDVTFTCSDITSGYPLIFVELSLTNRNEKLESPEDCEEIIVRFSEDRY